MYVRSPIFTSSITAGKLYEVDLATITNDDGDSITIQLSGCAHLGNKAWEIVPADRLTKEKETPMTDKGTPAEIAYDTALETLNLKEGDIVTVTGKWPSHSLGWKNSWVLFMDEFVGKRCVVGEISSDRTGIQLFWDGDDYWFPPHVLKKLADAPKKAEPVPTTEDEPMASDATLRDDFAIRILEGILANGVDASSTHGASISSAHWAYTMADAMMEARKKG